MLVYAVENEVVSVDVKDTLKAAHMAVKAYFLLHTLFKEEARIWYHAQHKGFLEMIRLLFSPSHSSRCVKEWPYFQTGVKVSKKYKRHTSSLQS